MLSLSPRIRIFLALQPVDLRKSFDGLQAVVTQALGSDPLSGYWFVFRNRAGDRLKILAWEEDGWAIWYKRLERGRFRFPDATTSDGSPRHEMVSLSRRCNVANASIDPPPPADPHVTPAPRASFGRPVGSRPTVYYATTVGPTHSTCRASAFAIC